MEKANSTKPFSKPDHHRQCPPSLLVTTFGYGYMDYVKKNLNQTKTDGENKLVSQPFSQADHHRQCSPLLQLPRQWVQQGLEQVSFIFVI